MNRLVKIETEKTVEEILEEIKKRAGDFDFVVREVFNMAEEFKNHDVEVDEDFVFYSIMLCNPQKAYKSIANNKLRGTVLLPPKQVTVYKDNKTGKTVVAYVALGKDFIKELFPDDNQLQEGLPKSCENIAKMVEGLS